MVFKSNLGVVLMLVAMDNILDIFLYQCMTWEKGLFASPRNYDGDLAY